MSYTIRFPRKGLVHIAGFEPATKGGGNDMGDHVSYAPESHCPTLTRRGHLMSEKTQQVTLRHEDDDTITPGRVRRVSRVMEWATAREVLEAAREHARIFNHDICGCCLAAAERTVLEEAPAIDREALAAERAELVARLAEIDALLG